MKNVYEFNNKSIYIKKPNLVNFIRIFGIFSVLFIFYSYIISSILLSKIPIKDFSSITLIIILTVLFVLIFILTTYNLFRDRDIQIHKELNKVSIKNKTYPITKETKVLINKIENQFGNEFYNLYLFIDNNNNFKLANKLCKNEMNLLKEKICEILEINFIIKESFFG
jgi:energy-coupling factor transporter transmembrane protein EcfT